MSVINQKMSKALKKISDIGSSSTQKYDAKDNLAGILFIAPMYIGFIVFVLFPALYSLFLSFTEWNFLGGFEDINYVGFDNYINLFSDNVFIESLKNTFVFTFSTVALQISLGLVLAVIIYRGIYLKKTLKIMIFVPYIASLVASAIVWKVLFHPISGPVNQFLINIGVENIPRWFADIDWAMPTIIMFTVWRSLGYFLIVYLAGLKSIPQSLYEAAKIDGANVVQQFRYITIPLISPTTFFLMITGFIGSFRAFDQIQITTQGGPGNATSVLVLYIYKTAFRFYKMGYASAIAIILFILVFAVTLIQWRGQKKWVNY